MNTEINQKISQFLDDELDHSELENLLLKIKQQPEAQKKMNRYQTLSHVLKADKVVIVGESFLDKVRHELKQEPHYFPTQAIVKQKQFSHWHKASLAIAASVVCAVLIVAQQTKMKNTGSETYIAQQEATVEKIYADNQLSTPTTQHERLKSYLQAHSDDLYTHGSLNSIPFVRVAHYE